MGRKIQLKHLILNLAHNKHSICIFVIFNAVVTDTMIYVNVGVFFHTIPEC